MLDQDTLSFIISTVYDRFHHRPVTGPHVRVVAVLEVQVQAHSLIGIPVGLQKAQHEVVVQSGESE